MSRTSETTVEEVKSEEIWVACASCDRVTAHRQLAGVRVYDRVPEVEIQLWEHYLTLECLGCRTVSFCHKSTNTEDEWIDPDTGRLELVESVKLYPGRIAGRPEMDGLWELPFGVATIYRETHAALANKLPILAGIGIRAIVEAVCKEKNSRGKDLAEKIDALAVLGVITPDGAAILHSLRFMGNDAAHETKAHSEEELHAAFEVVEYLLMGAYVLKSKAEKLSKSSRAAPKG